MKLILGLIMVCVFGCDRAAAQVGHDCDPSLEAKYGKGACRLARPGEVIVTDVCAYMPAPRGHKASDAGE